MRGLLRARCKRVDERFEADRALLLFLLLLLLLLHIALFLSCIVAGTSPH
jgi:hypothetical protein